MMGTFAEDIEKAADGEPILHVIIGALHDDYGSETIEELRSRAAEVVAAGYGGPRNLITVDHAGVPLSWEDARPLLDYKYDADYGSADCHAIWAWTPRWVLFVSTYDGATRVERVPRNPVEGGIPERYGGGG